MRLLQGKNRYIGDCDETCIFFFEDKYLTGLVKKKTIGKEFIYFLYLYFLLFNFQKFVRMLLKKLQVQNYGTIWNSEHEFHFLNENKNLLCYSKNYRG